MADEKQEEVQQTPGGYVGKDPAEIVTHFTEDGIVVVKQPKESPPEEKHSDKAEVSLG